MAFSLLRDWDLLQGRVVPHLVEQSRTGPVRTWSIGEARDAVSVAAALDAEASHRGGDVLHDDVHVFASDLVETAPALTFALRDVGFVPDPVRASRFHRSQRRWVPNESLSEQILLCRPETSVDLATARDAEGMLLARDRMRPSGLLVAARPPDEVPDGLEQDVSEPRLFHKTGVESDSDKRDEHRPAPNSDCDNLADTQKRQRLIESHRALARSVARRFSHRGVPLEDLEQVALYALVKAAKGYDSDRETAFATYARSTITGELKRYFRDRTWMVRVPRSLKERYVAVKDVRDELCNELGRVPTAAQIANRIGCEKTEVYKALDVADAYSPSSLDVPVSEEEPVTEVAVNDPGFAQALDKQRLQTVLPSLNERQLLIIRRLFFEGRTQQQLADELGVSQMQVSRLRNDTISRIRQLDASGSVRRSSTPTADVA